MSIGCFVAASWNSNASYFLGHVQIDHHRRYILVQLLTGLPKDVEVFCLYDLIGLAGYNPAVVLVGGLIFPED